MGQIFNRDSKTEARITGFTLNRKTVQWWILSQAKRGTITSQCNELAALSKKRKLVLISMYILNSVQPQFCNSRFLS